MRSLAQILKVTNATLCSQMPKMLFESDEKPEVVFQLLWVRFHQQDQSWKDGETMDSAWSNVTTGFFSPFTHKSEVNVP